MASEEASTWHTAHRIRVDAGWTARSSTARLLIEVGISRAYAFQSLLVHVLQHLPELSSLNRK